jgi:hypothetical protein
MAMIAWATEQPLSACCWTRSKLLKHTDVSPHLARTCATRKLEKCWQQAYVTGSLMTKPLNDTVGAIIGNTCYAVLDPVSVLNPRPVTLQVMLVSVCRLVYIGQLTTVCRVSPLWKRPTRDAVRTSPLLSLSNVTLKYWSQMLTMVNPVSRTRAPGPKAGDMLDLMEASRTTSPPSTILLPPLLMCSVPEL